MPESSSNTIPTPEGNDDGTTASDEQSSATPPKNTASAHRTTARVTIHLSRQHDTTTPRNDYGTNTFDDEQHSMMGMIQRTITADIIVSRAEVVVDKKVEQPAAIRRYTRSNSSSNSTTNKDGSNTYSMCSAVLQIGKLFGIQPPQSTPSFYISSIFDKLLEKWMLFVVESPTPVSNEDDATNDNKNVASSSSSSSAEKQRIKQLSDIQDGDTLMLCCGDYTMEIQDSSKKAEVDFLSLLPLSHQANVSVAAVTAPESDAEHATSADVEEKKGDVKDHHCCIDVDDGDDDSVIEDVTELYAVQSKSRASPEIIEVEDVSEDDSLVEASDKKAKASTTNDRRDQNKNGHDREDESCDSSSENDNDDSEDDETSSRESNNNSSSDIEDVTEIMLEKKRRQAKQNMELAEELESDPEVTVNSRGTKRKKRKSSGRQSTAAKRKRTKITESPIEVLIDEKDIPIAPGAKSQEDDGKNGDTEGDGDKHHSMKQRIIKLLNTGFHGESNENEARNAMKLARRLMERHNLDQAVLLQERGDGSLNDFSTTNDGTDGSMFRGGIVTAKIRNRKKKSSLSSLPRWNDFLVQPICANFRVEAFKTMERGNRLWDGECSVTFYGIRTNAQLAAYAFKMASERIALMAASYDPPTTGTAAVTRTARLSYALGIVNGLDRDIKEGLRKEEERRKSKLAKARRAAKTGESYDEDGSNVSDSDGIGESCADDGDEGHNLKEMEEDHSEQKTKIAGQLEKLEREDSAQLALIDEHKKIASNVLKVSLHACVVH